VLLVGAGETGELTLKHLVSRGIGSIRIANRTRERADALAAAFQGTIVPFESLPDGLREADIVITSVAATEPILRPPELQRAMKLRANTPLFVIDIGVPRNVDPAVRKIDNVFLYDIDALNGIVTANVGRRKAELPRVREILDQELALFRAWQNSLQVAPTITAFREALENIRVQEVEKHQHRFAAEDRELLDLVTRRIVNKILHQPTTVLKQGAEDPSAGQAITRLAALRELFGITSNGGGDHA
jgi:glutamyl-tRNA reductase